MNTLIAGLLILPSLALRGLMISKCWLWFWLPLFGGHPIRILQAIGLASFAAALTFDPYLSREGLKGLTALEQVSISIIMNLGILAMCFVTHCAIDMFGGSL